MAVEDDILKTLKQIESVLRNSSTTTGFGRTSPRGAGTQRRDESSRNNETRTYRATTAAMSSLTDQSDRLGRSFSGLSRTVLNTRSNFIEMNRSMRAYSRNIPNNISNAAAQSPQTNPSALNARGLTLGLTSSIQSAIQRILPRLPSFGNTNNSIPQAASTIANISGINRAGGLLTRGFGNLAGRVNFAGVALVGIISQLSGAVSPLIKDVLALQSAGIQASSALGGLYIDAARAGLSLAEYTKILQESSPAVTRFNSMDDFNKTLQVSRDRLENLGIFGEEATKLAASLSTSTAVLGIPQQRMADVTNAQISVFETLRKSSLLTAEQFQQLTHQLSQQQEVQSQLLGLSGPERAARLAELTSMRTFGLSLGASKEASDAFGDALIKQRNLTAPKRFEAAGRIRQSGAILGMDASSTEQLARLSRRKNLTGEDRETALRLGAEMQSRIESFMNSGNIQQENIAEQLQASLDGSGIGNLLKSAGNLSLSTQSGQAGVNKDFATGTSDLLKATGRMMAWLDGLEKNPIANAIAGALGSAAFSLGLGAALGRILTRGRLGVGAAAAASSAGGAAASTGVVSRIGSTIGATTDLLRRLTNLGALGPAIVSSGQSILSAGQSVLGSARGMAASTSLAFNVLRGSGMTITQTIGSMLSGLASSAGRGIATATGAVSGLLTSGVGKILSGAFRFLGGSGVLSSILGGVMEIFTGDLNSAFNAADDSSWFDNGLKGLVTKSLGKIGDVIGAMIRGFATGITGMGDGLISVWNWSVGSFFDGMKINLTSSLTNMFDSAWTSIIIMFKELKLKAAKFFGFKDTAKDIEKDIEVAKQTQSKLQADGQATLTTVGDANQKLTTEQQKAAEKTTSNLQSATKSVGVVTGIAASTQNLTSQLLSDTAALRQQTTENKVDAIKKQGDVITSLSNNQKQLTSGIVAMPGQLARAPIVEPGVNKEQASPPAPAVSNNTQPQNQPNSPTQLELLSNQFAIMNQLLTQILTAEQGQMVGIENLARLNGRPMFANNEDLFNKLNRS